MTTPSSPRPSSQLLPQLQMCWNQIGIVGDRSCPELLTHTHCRNCPVYSIEGRRLLERSLPDGYLQEWTALLATLKQTTAQVKIVNGVSANDAPENSVSMNGVAREKVLVDVKPIAVVIFRIHNEWLALPASVFKEVTPSSPIHTIPHRSNQILLGLVNIHGELQICVSLAHLLTLEIAKPETTKPAALTHSIPNPRMMVLERESERWVFPVDEIYGVQRFQLNELKPAPTNVAKSANTYTKGLIGWRKTHVSFLDDELLFYTLNRRVL